MTTDRPAAVPAMDLRPSSGPAPAVVGTTLATVVLAPIHRTVVTPIARCHVAFGGTDFVLLGPRTVWTPKRQAECFLPHLLPFTRVHFLETDDDFFAWARDSGYSPVAVEIRQSAIPVASFDFPARPALVFGSEAAGLSDSFLARCAASIRIPLQKPAGSLNAACAAAIVLYELRRGRGDEGRIAGGKYV